MISNYIAKYIKNDPIYDLTMAIIYFLISYVVTKFVNSILNKLSKKFSKKDGKISSLSVISLLKEPIDAGIWVLCIYKTLAVTERNIIFLKEIVVVLVSYIVFWLCIRFINHLSNKIIENKEKDNEDIDYAGIDFIKKLIQIIMFFVILLVCMGKLGVNLSSLLAIGGFGGAAIGLGAQDLFKNIFGTLSIYLNKPFGIGDWIASPDKEVEGFVEQIGWRQTAIRTFGQYPIYVPNSVFNEIIIENKGRMRSRQIDECIPIVYLETDKINKITSEIETMIISNKGINQKCFLMVRFESISKPAVLNLKIIAYTNAVDLITYSKVKQEVLLSAINIIKDNGGELAYDITKILLQNNRNAKVSKFFN